MVKIIDTPTEPTPKPINTGRPILVAYATILTIVAIFHFVVEPLNRDSKLYSSIRNEADYVQAADVALFQYTAAHGDKYPDFSGDMSSILKPYVKDQKVLAAIPHFVWNTKFSGKPDGFADNPNEQVIVFSVVPRTSTVIVGSAGGFVSRRQISKLPEIIAKMNALKPWPEPF